MIKFINTVYFIRNWFIKNKPWDVKFLSSLVRDVAMSNNRKLKKAMLKKDK